ncbi:MAG TPA: DUF1080 domain-containing protein [Planctomycetaceae bacterium]|nr:DUF1080 domain-containing protein [Planctomycetaceae bacterium]
MKRLATTLAFGLTLAVTAAWGAEQKTEGWICLFDGKSMAGWKAGENPSSWSLENGALVCHGPRSHLFYVGDAQPFVNFEFQADVMTTPGSNSGIYFHTRYQEKGWPRYGYEAQVNNSHRDPKRTGSLYGVVDVLQAPAKDNEWFTMTIRVQGKRIVIQVNDKVVVDYTEPQGKKPFSGQFERRLGKGTFALQAHDPKSKVYFKNIRVRRLP